jgi:hypothetical protein
VPNFILIIGYDGTGVWLNDPGISWGRGYHISYAQLAHAIDWFRAGRGTGTWSKPG